MRFCKEIRTGAPKSGNSKPPSRRAYRARSTASTFFTDDVAGVNRRITAIA